MARKDERTPDQGSTAKPRNKQSGIKRTGSIAIAAATILGGIAAGISIWQFGMQATQGTSHSITGSPMLSEQRLLAELVPGDTYAKLQDLIGAVPDNQKTLKSGRTLYQFDRLWEYIDLLVKDGNVLSVGAYAKTTTFKATLDAGGYHVILNGPPIAQQAGGLGGAVGICGGNIGGYFFEGGSLPNVNQEASIALGWATTSGKINVPLSACEAVDDFPQSPLYGCSKLQNLNGYPSSRFLDCLNSSKAGQRIGQLSPAAVVVTADGQGIVPDMLGILPWNFVFLGPSGL